MKKCLGEYDYQNPKCLKCSLRVKCMLKRYTEDDSDIDCEQIEEEYEMEKGERKKWKRKNFY